MNIIRYAVFKRPKFFGISKANPQLFGRVIYNDYLRTMDSGFLPPAVLPILNGDKLNTEQEAKLQEYIGNERKKLVEPYVNDMSKIIGFNKTYSELETDEKKKYVLQQLYDIGRARGVEKFYSDYKKLRPKDKPIDYQFEIEKGIFNDLIKLQ